MHYFVTGATGFIGGRLARKLRGQGHEVRALVRTPAAAADLEALGIKLVPGDITDAKGLPDAMAGCDGVYHVAAWYKVGVRDRSQAERINVGGTRNVLEAMRDSGIAKGVYTSTLAVYSNTHGKAVDESYRFTGEHLSAYDRTKWQAHYEVAEPMMKDGLPLVIVQPGLVYGPGDTSSVGRTFAQYLKKKLPMLPTGPRLCWAHVDDIVDGHITAMEKGTPGEAYNICGPEHSLVEAFALAERITGVPAPKMTGGPGMMKLMSAMMTPLNAVIPLPEDYHPETLRVLADVTYLGDASKAKAALGFTPRPLEEGLRETLFALMDELGMAKPEAV